jgi:hypothetical protein
VPVWALTGYGRGVAEEIVPYLRPPAAHDVGHRSPAHKNAAIRLLERRPLDEQGVGDGLETVVPVEKNTRDDR